MNSFEVCRRCVPGDVLLTEDADDSGRALLYDIPRVSLTFNKEHTRFVPVGAIALVVFRQARYDDWAFVLCDGNVGWINALSIAPTAETLESS